MSDTLPTPIATKALQPTPEEQLTYYVTNALRQSGYPPLQYLDVAVRDGHVYLTARVPTLFLTHRTSIVDEQMESDHDRRNEIE